MLVRTGLTHWPLVGIGDGGSIHDINSSSLARFQAYSAVAYVSRRALVTLRSRDANAAADRAQKESCGVR